MQRFLTKRHGNRNKKRENVKLAMTARFEVIQTGHDCERVERKLSTMWKKFKVNESKNKFARRCWMRRFLCRRILKHLRLKTEESFVSKRIHSAECLLQHLAFWKMSWEFFHIDEIFKRAAVSVFSAFILMNYKWQNEQNAFGKQRKLQTLHLDTH